MAKEYWALRGKDGEIFHFQEDPKLLCLPKENHPERVWVLTNKEYQDLLNKEKLLDQIK